MLTGTDGCKDGWMVANINMFHILWIAVLRGFKCQAFTDPEWFPVVVKGSRGFHHFPKKRKSIQSLKIFAQIDIIISYSYYSSATFSWDLNIEMFFPSLH